LNSKGYPLVANIGHGIQSFIYVMLNVILDHFRLSWGAVLITCVNDRDTVNEQPKIILMQALGT
tara:strand:+ start:32 stop:223 length:192 start_codon:yes stop_codon:yes gene_type:complete